MRKPLFILLPVLFTLLALHPAKAQLEAKVGPVALLFTGISLAAEYKVSNEFGAELHTFFAEGEGILWGTAKYYLNPRYGADRFHIGAFLAAGSLDPGIGFMIGTKSVSPKNIVFDFGIGVGRSFSGGFIPYGKIQVGYRFGPKPY